MMSQLLHPPLQFLLQQLVLVQQQLIQNLFLKFLHMMKIKTRKTTRLHVININFFGCCYNEFYLAPLGNGGSTDRYTWTQTLKETTVVFEVPNEVILSCKIHSAVISPENFFITFLGGCQANKCQIHSKDTANCFGWKRGC